MSMPLGWRRAAIVFWCLGGLVLALAALIGGGLLTGMPGLAVAIALFPLTLGVGVGLGVCYRYASRRPLLWGALITALLVSGALSQLPQGGGQAVVQSVAALAFLGAGTVLMVLSVALLFRYDLSLPLIALFTLGAMWGLVIWWLLGGDFIVAMLAMLSNPSAPAPSIFWPTVLFNTAICLTPLALASFAWHTVRLVRRELRPAPLPPAPDASPTSQGAPNDHEHPVR